MSPKIPHYPNLFSVPSRRPRQPPPLTSRLRSGGGGSSSSIQPVGNAGDEEHQLRGPCEPVEPRGEAAERRQSRGVRRADRPDYSCCAGRAGIGEGAGCVGNAGTYGVVAGRKVELEPEPPESSTLSLSPTSCPPTLISPPFLPPSFSPSHTQ